MKSPNNERVAIDFFSYVMRYNGFTFPSIIEIGCGYGLAAKNMAKIAKKLFLIDTDANAINFVSSLFTQNDNIQAKCMSSSDVNGTYNIVYYFLSLHHIENVEKEIVNVKKILAKDGLLFICDYEPNPSQSLHSYDMVPHEGLIQKDLLTILVKHGFDIINSERISTLYSQKGNETVMYPVYGITTHIVFNEKT